jgi:hypothetical protein
MPILLKAKCQIIRPTFRIVKSQFDIDPDYGLYGEYVVLNLMRERGDMFDGDRYEISIRSLSKN